MNWSDKLEVGDVVSYRDVNQWPQKGRLVAFGKGKHGGDCVVKWDRFDFESEECSFNLYSWHWPGANNAWRDGIAAHNRGVPLDGNPNDDDTLRRAWAKGWESARRANAG
jgi:hypothetical protein